MRRIVAFLLTAFFSITSQAQETAQPEQGLEPSNSFSFVRYRADYEVKADATSVETALAEAEAAHGPARILMNVAGIGSAKRIVGKDGSAAPLEDFVRVINVNLVGTYNISRLFAARCAKLDPVFAPPQ